ncbi:hypothetical protein JX266_004008 [Neoarthrinium moseri]|nr:hypothetical protein JX266_004008 [Neoarthrinium moseri]
MRLINAETFEIREFTGDCHEKYAILSHTWGEEECSLQHMSKPDVRYRKGYEKIVLSCRQACRDGVAWIWVDTTAELSEAINSMFRWYRQSYICYAYLADVHHLDQLEGSRWFTRGWTLQELIAPLNVRFYSSDWNELGSKKDEDLRSRLGIITNIESHVLETEDQAYSLMGIFDVNMPLIYGEGAKAFRRLQEEIIKNSDDQSLFAWGIPSPLGDVGQFSRSPKASMPPAHGLLADSPGDFANSHQVLRVPFAYRNAPLVEVRNGVRFEAPVFEKGSDRFVVLACAMRGAKTALIGIPFRDWNPAYSARHDTAVLISSRQSLQSTENTVLHFKEKAQEELLPLNTLQILRLPDSRDHNDPFFLDEIYCLRDCTYFREQHSISFSVGWSGPIAALFFSPNPRYQDNVGKGKKEAAPERIHERCLFISFSVVLGRDTEPWAAFVPLMREDHAEEDSARFALQDAENVERCMTKSQLKSHLYQGGEGLSFLRRGEGMTQRSLQLWKARNTQRHNRYMRAVLHVQLHEGSANFFERCIFASIGLTTLGNWDADVAFGTKSGSLWKETVPDWRFLDTTSWFTETSHPYPRSMLAIPQDGTQGRS